MDYSGAAWDLLAEYLRDARGGRTIPEVAAASGVSGRSIGEYERATVYKSPPPKMRQLADFYGWAPGSLRRILLNRGEPIYLPRVTEPAPLIRADMTRAEIRAAIAELPFEQKRLLAEVLLGEWAEPH